MLDFLIFGRCHPEGLGYTSQRKGCSIKLLHYDNNKNEVTIQVVVFDRHIFIDIMKLRRQDSNLQMVGPKSTALQLGLLSCIYLLKEKFK